MIDATDHWADSSEDEDKDESGESVYETEEEEGHCDTDGEWHFDNINLLLEKPPNEN